MILDDTMNHISMHIKTKQAAVKFSRNQCAQIVSKDEILVTLWGPRIYLAQTF
jgi:predicted metalloenzyme YecM